MKKFFLLLFCFVPISVYALEMPEINSEAAIIYDLDQDVVVLEKNSEELRPIASLTKIMSVITAIENIDNLKDTITITNEMLNGIYWNASVAGLKVGDTVTYLDLLYAAILPSGADATQILAYAVSGNIESFVLKMNELADKIGANNTKYVNTTGLDQDDAYSTATDQMKILKYALNNSIFKKVYTTKNYTLSNGLEVEATINKYNKLLNLDTSKIIGSKTGNTTKAGLCMSALFYHEDHEMLLITLGAEMANDIPYNLMDTLLLIDFVNEFYEIPKQEMSVFQSEVVDNVNDNQVSVHFETVCVIVIILFIVIMLFCKGKKSRR